MFFIIDGLLTHWWRVGLGVGRRPNCKDYLNDLTDVRLIGFQNIEKLKWLSFGHVKAALSPNTKSLQAFRVTRNSSGGETCNSLGF